MMPVNIASGIQLFAGMMVAARLWGDERVFTKQRDTVN
jgi:hypothetical protein